MTDQQTNDALESLRQLAAHTQWIAELLETLNETLAENLAALTESAQQIRSELFTSTLVRPG